MRALFTIAGLAAVLLWGTAASSQSVSIQLQDGVFKVVGWQASATPPAKGWASLFAIYTGSGDVPPMAGRYAVESGALVFRPQFPLAAGARYRAVFQMPGGKPIEALFNGPPKQTVPMTRVEHIYPSASVLPSNDLKLYIYFSAPMSRGEAWQHIQLLDAAGKALPDIFLEFGQELWDVDNRRLTIWFDPGRIKRGLASNVNLGPPIEDGKRYTLAVDREWQDARGVPLVAAYKKIFTGGPPDRVAPDPKKWRITPPASGTSKPLIVDFLESMDYVGLQKSLSIGGPNGSVAGQATISHEEMLWSFTPSRPWTAGEYKLLVRSSLEDLAANKIGQLFDMDVFDKVSESIEQKTYPVPFRVQ